MLRCERFWLWRQSKLARFISCVDGNQNIASNQMIAQIKRKREKKNIFYRIISFWWRQMICNLLMFLVLMMILIPLNWFFSFLFLLMLLFNVLKVFSGQWWYVRIRVLMEWCRDSQAWTVNLNFKVFYWWIARSFIINQLFNKLI